MRFVAAEGIARALRRYRLSFPFSLGLASLAAGGGVLLRARPGTPEWGYAGAVALLACAAGALGAAAYGVVAAVLQAARAPGEAARAIWSNTTRHPLRMAGNAAMIFAIAGSLLGAALLPISFYLRFRNPAVPADPAASGLVGFAQGFPYATLFTYLAGFWTVTVFWEVRDEGLLRWYSAFTRRRPALAAVFSYGALGLLGTWLLTLPFCQQDVLQASLLSSFFISFSALTTTGLTNVDITAQWNGLGELVILCLVLAGGLGIFLFWALVSNAGRHLRAARLGQQEMVEDPELAQYVRRTVILFVSCIAAGAALLAVLDDRASSIGGRVFRSLFHAAAAFCNAGFTLDSSAGSFGSYPYGLVMSALVVLGGLGPAVLLFPRSRHARVSAATSAALILVGALVFYVFSRQVEGNTFVLSVYQSIAARTAGFGWIDFTHLPDLAALWLMVLMFLGGCPGSTAGGAKLTVLFVLRQAFRITGHGPANEQKAARESATDITEVLTIVGLFALVAVVGALMLGLLETQPGVPVLFEVVSALSTTGLSMGLTPRLSPASLLALVPIMLIGKVGPVILLQAMFRGRPDADDFLQRLKDGRVLVG